MRTSIKVAALAVGALLTLTACSKPEPSVTVFSAANSVHAEAACWAADCSAIKPGSSVTLAVTPGRVLGISVDSEVAAAGWQPAVIVNGQAQTLEQKVIYKRYWRMTFPEGLRGSFPAQGLTLQIASRAATTGEQGVWFFTLIDAETTDNA